MSHRQYQYPSLMEPIPPPPAGQGPAVAAFQMVEAGGAVLVRQIQYKGMMKPTFVEVAVVTGTPIHYYRRFHGVGS